MSHQLATLRSADRQFYVMSHQLATLRSADAYAIILSIFAPLDWMMLFQPQLFQNKGDLRKILTMKHQFSPCL